MSAKTTAKMKELATAAAKKTGMEVSFWETFLQKYGLQVFQLVMQIIEEFMKPKVMGAAKTKHHCPEELKGLLLEACTRACETACATHAACCAAGCHEDCNDD